MTVAWGGRVAETRRYDSAVRLEKARRTRARILATAHDLFLAGGYVGTTLDSVASGAGVSQQTVYNLVGGKATLFKTVYDVTLAGDDEPVPIAARPEFQRIYDAPSAREALARYAAVGRQILHRVGPLVGVATAQAAAGDRDLREFVETIETERATGTYDVVRHLADRFGLRPGLTVARAADILWTLSAPEMADRLVVRRGWTWERYQEWLVDTVHHCLFENPVG
jgi:AcrR family transcriptional regulator